MICLQDHSYCVSILLIKILVLWLNFYFSIWNVQTQNVAGSSTFQPHPKVVYSGEGGSHSAHLPRGTVCFQPIGAFVTTNDSSRLNCVTSVSHIPMSPPSWCFLHCPGPCFVHRYSIKPWPGCTNMYSPFGKLNISTIPILSWKIVSDNSQTNLMIHHCALLFLKSMLSYTRPIMELVSNVLEF